MRFEYGRKLLPVRENTRYRARERGEGARLTMHAGELLCPLG